RDVARFDRCVTCHQGIDKTAPGSATEPAYPAAHEVVLTLNTPAVSPKELWLDEYGEPIEEVDGQPLIKETPEGVFAIDSAGKERVGPNGVPLKARVVHPSLRNVYGFTLAEQGVVAPGDVTVEATWPMT